jgi:membrane-bound lytic murein transglycosylase B
MRMGSAMTPGLVACLVLSCTGPDTPGEADGPSSGLQTTTVTPSRPHSAPPTTPSGSPGVLPAAPSARPKALARELDRVVATLRDRRSTPAQVRRAGKYQQLAVRRLATASNAFRRTVLARVGRETALVVSGDLRAARSLVVLTAPQERLPRWRIIAPPPVAELRGYYAEAQRRTGVHWTYLAAIHLVETRMGRIRGTSTAGAQGPMQFLPSTWEQYGAGGDINDPRDAILGAARLLQANGAPEDMAPALYRYNPSDRYVRAITEHARTMQRAPYSYRGYWHWRVLYRHVRGVYVLPEGYPGVRPVLLERR